MSTNNTTITTSVYQITIDYDPSQQSTATDNGLPVKVRMEVVGSVVGALEAALKRADWNVPIESHHAYTSASGYSGAIKRISSLGDPEIYGELFSSNPHHENNPTESDFVQLTVKLDGDISDSEQVNRINRARRELKASLEGVVSIELVDRANQNRNYVLSFERPVDEEEKLPV